MTNSDLHVAISTVACFLEHQFAGVLCRSKGAFSHHSVERLPLCSAAFDQSLCSWGKKVPAVGVNVFEVFFGSGCPRTDDQMLPILLLAPGVRHALQHHLLPPAPQPNPSPALPPSPALSPSPTMAPAPVEHTHLVLDDPPFDVPFLSQFDVINFQLAAIASGVAATVKPELRMVTLICT
jgi:hypothetical protein